MIELRQMIGTLRVKGGKTRTVEHPQDGVYFDGRWIGTAHRSPGGPIVIHRPPLGFSEADLAAIRKEVDGRDGGEFPQRIVRVIWPENSSEPEWIKTSGEASESWI